MKLSIYLICRDLSGGNDAINVAPPCKKAFYLNFFMANAVHSLSISLPAMRITA